MATLISSNKTHAKILPGRHGRPVKCEVTDPIKSVGAIQAPHLTRRQRREMQRQAMKQQRAHVKEIQK